HLINIVTRQISISRAQDVGACVKGRISWREEHRLVRMGNRTPQRASLHFDNHFYKHNGKCCSRGYNATNGLAEQAVFNDSLPINEIGKRTRSEERRVGKE